MGDHLVRETLERDCEQEVLSSVVMMFCYSLLALLFPSREDYACPSFCTQHTGTSAIESRAEVSEGASFETVIRACSFSAAPK